jgi:hypothetical protein
LNDETNAREPKFFLLSLCYNITTDSFLLFLESWCAAFSGCMKMIIENQKKSCKPPSAVSIKVGI